MDIYKIKLDDRYVVEKELGKGGLGIVYLARDLKIPEIKVVIKTILEELFQLDDLKFRIRFNTEIKALATIKHSGVVGVSDRGHLPDGRPFFVMPYVEGENLRSKMSSQRMELKRVAHIIEQLSIALSAAHEKKVVHRDIKPENVMLNTLSSGAEMVTLIDFGIASIKESQSAQSKSTGVSGTVPYMAPEQLRGKPLPTSDIWSLGVMAYELVTGQRPFLTDNEVILAELQKAGLSILPKMLCPELLESTQAVILKALRYKAEERYQIALEMGKEFINSLNHAIEPDKLRTVKSSSEPAKKWLYTPISSSLRKRCIEFFDICREFDSPEVLRSFFDTMELKPFAHCIGKSSSIEYDKLISSLQKSGKTRPGLLVLLEELASHYEGDFREDACDSLIEDLKREIT